MPRVHHVKKARKKNPVVDAGEEYYWWKFAFRPKQFSKTYPKRSQLTQSDFLSQVYDLEDDRIAKLSTDMSLEDLQSERDELVEEIRTLGEECQEKLDNMPEQLQYAPSGETLQNRVDECENWASELENIDISTEEDLSDEEKETEKERVVEELSSCNYNGE